MRKKLPNRRYVKIELDRDLIKPVTSDLFKQVAERPKQCCLDVTKAERKLGVRFLIVEKGLMKLKEQMKGWRVLS